MANDGNQEQNGLSNTNKILLIVGLLVLVAVIIYASVGGGSEGEEDRNNDKQEQNNENGDNGQSQQEQPGTAPSDQVRGNLQATGTLRESGNPARGNYMLESNVGNIYVFTSRDYSGQVGRRVTLQADGTYNRFTFLGFTDPSSLADAGNNSDGNNTGDNAEVDAGDVGGASEEVSDVVFNGVLRATDNHVKGNYMIVSGNTKVYYQSARNYNPWIGSQVRLDAVGTINSFTEGVLSR